MGVAASASARRDAGHQFPDSATGKVPTPVVTASAAVLVPVDVGLKRTLIEQVAPAASDVPQEPVALRTLNWFAPAPLIAVAIVVLMLPVLLTDTVFDALEPTATPVNVSAVGVTVITATAVTEVPARFTTGVPPLVLMLRVAVLLPAGVDVGANLTLSVQLAPCARVEPHPFTSVKSPALAPPSTAPVIDSVPVPLLVSVTVCAVLAVPLA